MKIAFCQLRFKERKKERNSIRKEERSQKEIKQENRRPSATATHQSKQVISSSSRLQMKWELKCKLAPIYVTKRVFFFYSVAKPIQRLSIWSVTTHTVKVWFMLKQTKLQRGQSQAQPTKWPKLKMVSDKKTKQIFHINQVDLTALPGTSGTVPFERPEGLLH